MQMSCRNLNSSKKANIEKLLKEGDSARLSFILVGGGMVWTSVGKFRRSLRFFFYKLSKIVVNRLRSIDIKFVRERRNVTYDGHG